MHYNNSNKKIVKLTFYYFFKNLLQLEIILLESYYELSTGIKCNYYFLKIFYKRKNTSKRRSVIIHYNNTNKKRLKLTIFFNTLSLFFYNQLYTNALQCTLKRNTSQFLVHSKRDFK